MKIVITSGYYNPLHVGHIRYLQAAGELGHHIAIVNSDHQVELKGSVPFMNERDRLEIIDALNCVDMATLSIDEGVSVSKTLEQIREHYHDRELVFAKGGDRTSDNIPEYDICKQLGIKMIFGVGGGKIRASSELIKHANETSSK